MFYYQPETKSIPDLMMEHQGSWSFYSLSEFPEVPVFQDFPKQYKSGRETGSAIKNQFPVRGESVEPDASSYQNTLPPSPSPRKDIAPPPSRTGPPTENETPLPPPRNTLLSSRSTEINHGPLPSPPTKKRGALPPPPPRKSPHLAQRKQMTPPNTNRRAPPPPPKVNSPSTGRPPLSTRYQAPQT